MRMHKNDYADLDGKLKQFEVHKKVGSLEKPGLRTVCVRRVGTLEY